MTIVVYTDGACSGNPGPGGWAWAVVDGAYESGFDAHSTNQRMEVMAAAQALATLGAPWQPLEIRSDSTYVVNCFRDRWWRGWLDRGWKNSQRKDVANRDLWEPFIEAYQSLGGSATVRFQWVKGHAGDPWNERVDELAVAAVHRRAGESGTAMSGPSAAHNEPSAKPEVGAAAAVVFGPRDVETSEQVLTLLRGWVRQRRRSDPDVQILSGLRMGVEQLAAQAALAEGARLRVVLPYPEPDRDWPALQRRQFATQVAAAETVETLADTAPTSAQGIGAALRRRDAHLIEAATEALVLAEPDDPRLRRLTESLIERLGAAAVSIIDMEELSP